MTFIRFNAKSWKKSRLEDCKAKFLIEVGKKGKLKHRFP